MKITRCFSSVLFFLSLFFKYFSWVLKLFRENDGLTYKVDNNNKLINVFKMKKMIYTLAMLTLLAVCACGGTGAKSDSFGQAEALKAEEIAVNEILQPRQWTVSNGKVVMISPNTDSLFFVYSLPDFKFMYSTGRKGEGPKDFYPYVGFANSQSGGNDFLQLSDYKNDAVVEYMVGDDSLSKKESYPRHSTKGVFGAYYILSSHDFIISLRNAKGDEKEVMYVRRADDGSVVDSIETSSLVECEYDDNGNMYQRSSIIGSSVLLNGRKVALVYDLVDRVEMYEISKEGKIIKGKVTGDDITSERIANVKSFRESKRGGGKQHGIISCFATKGKIYSYYIDAEFVPKEGSGRSDIIFNAKQIRVYDWNGDCVALYDLEKEATAFIVSPDDKFLYTRNDMLDFDHVFVYQLK